MDDEITSQGCVIVIRDINERQEKREGNVEKEKGRRTERDEESGKDEENGKGWMGKLHFGYKR